MLQEAPLAPARLDGFRVQARSSDDGSSRTDWFFAVTVTPQGGQLFRTGCKQRIPNSREHLRVGMPLLVRHEGSKAIIDWAESLDALGLEGDNEAFGWKPLRTPPENGIEDRTLGSDSKRLARGFRTTATLTGLEPFTNFLGVQEWQRRNLHVHLADSPTGPREATLTKVTIPDYAQRLLHDQAQLPVAVDPDKPDRITIDWVAAASA